MEQSKQNDGCVEIVNALRSLEHLTKDLPDAKAEIVELHETEYAVLREDGRGATAALLLFELGLSPTEALDALEQATFWVKLLHNVGAVGQFKEDRAVATDEHGELTQCPACGAPKRFIAVSHNDMKELYGNAPVSSENVIYFCSNCDSGGTPDQLLAEANMVIPWRD